MRRCECPSCRARDLATFERIIDANYNPRDVARLAESFLPPIPEWEGTPVPEAPLPR